MTAYKRIVFADDYYTPAERYEQLLKEIELKENLFLNNLKKKLIAENQNNIDITIKLCQQKFIEQKLALKACWDRSQLPNTDIFQVRFSEYRNAEFYVIECLARMCKAFDNPNDEENIKQIGLLAASLPTKNDALWHEVKAGLFFIATIAVTVLTVIGISLLIGPAFPPLFCAIACCIVPLILGSLCAALMGKQFVAADFANDSQEVKKNLVEGLHFFNTKISPSAATLTATSDKNPSEVEQCKPTETLGNTATSFA